MATAAAVRTAQIYQAGLTEGTSLYVSRGPHDVPHNAIRSGTSPCGEVYVGAVVHNNMVMPCKIIPKDSCCYFPYFGKEHQTPHCTYLVLNQGYSYEWVGMADGALPPRAALVGKATNGERFAVGRVTVDDERCVGKIVSQHRVCYTPKSGRELQHKFYDVLVIKPPSTPVVQLSPGTSLYVSRGTHDVPHNAISTGVSPVGQVYVGYIQHSNESCAAKIVPKYHMMYYPFQGKEHSISNNITFLVVQPGYTYEWVASSHGNIVPNAVTLGKAGSGEYFHVGRVTINDERCVGKILLSHGACYTPWGGKEHTKAFYDILVVKKNY